MRTRLLPIDANEAITGALTCFFAKMMAAITFANTYAGKPKAKNCNTNAVFLTLTLNEANGWTAKVENDRTKQVPTLAFNKDFAGAASDLKEFKKKITKELNTVSNKIDKIKKDGKTGEMLKNDLTSQASAYEQARQTFLKAVANLYNKAIGTYNDWQQDMYDTYAQSKITNQGSATNVQADNISSDDNVGVA